jgi:4-aminobutyrate aminotransferase / (S)-3-amino-2-methylpropionate transaminase / 5-aminovalerate transaminase
MSTAVQLPGRSEALHARRREAVVRGVSSAYPVFVDRAEGVRLWDADGREYLDFASGIGTLNLGHRHPRVVAAMREQLERFTHTCFQVVQYEGYVELAERLNRLAPGTSAKKTLLLSSGAEATENAVKIARVATGRSGVVAFHWGYHGRTLLALTMTGKVSPYRQNFGPWAPDVYHVPYPYALHGWTAERSLAALHELFETEVAPQHIAAIIIEPVLGEGGFVPAPFEFLRDLRRIADRHGIVFIADEVQTGFGRTGKMFAVEHADIEPDLITIAKSIAGGLPLSAVVGRAGVMDAVEPGGLGGTFAGNPVACAAALATLDVFESEDVLGAACRIGDRIRARLESLARRYPQIAEVRGLGAMVAMELADAPPDARGRNRAKQIVDDACGRGLIVLTAGPKGNTIRFLVPLVATDEDLDAGLDLFEQSCAAVLAGEERGPT